MKLAPRLLLSLLPLLCSCEKKEASDGVPVYGEPIGIQMEASQGVPAFEIAIAVSKGVSVEPLVPPLSGLLHKALRACPDFVRAAAANPTAATQVAFAVEQGKTKDAAATVKGAECVTANLNAQELPGLVIKTAAAPPQGAPADATGAAPKALSVIAMLRFNGASGPNAEGRTP
jgi:hypothetical protein